MDNAPFERRCAEFGEGSKMVRPLPFGLAAAYDGVKEFWMTTTDRIAVDPKIMGGQSVVRGTRITVALILRELGRGATPAEVVDQYPQLKLEDIRGAATYAAAVVSGETLLAAE